MSSVLVVDDEPRIVQLVRDYLERAGFDVSVARDGPSALAAVAQRRPDLVVLDLGLPGLDGLDVTRRLRQGSGSAVPIIMLTARAEESDKIVGPGARRRRLPDQAVQPARAGRARPGGPAPRTRLRRDPGTSFRIGDGRARRAADARHGRRPARSTSPPTEFQILATLAREPGRIFTRAQLLDAVHGVAFESYERAIDAHVKNIRRKLEPDPRAPRFVQTVFGVGYRFAEPDA